MTSTRQVRFGGIGSVNGHALRGAEKRTVTVIGLIYVKQGLRGTGDWGFPWYIFPVKL